MTIADEGSAIEPCSSDSTFPKGVTRGGANAIGPGTMTSSRASHASFSAGLAELYGSVLRQRRQFQIRDEGRDREAPGTHFDSSLLADRGYDIDMEGPLRVK